MRRSLFVMAATIALFIAGAVPASASTRPTFSQTVYTSGTAAVKGTVTLTWIDNDEVNDVDMSATDYKCDNRGATVSIEVKIRTVVGTTTWIGTAGDSWRISTGGCGTTTTARDMYRGTTALTDASAIYSARLRVCLKDAPCYTAYNDNPYSNDPDSSTG